MHLFPHSRAMPNVILPVNVQVRIFTRHDLLMRQWLRLVRVKIPVPCPNIVERMCQRFIVALVWKPTEGDDIEVTALGPRLRWSISTWLPQNLAGWRSLIMLVWYRDGGSNDGADAE